MQPYAAPVVLPWPALGIMATFFIFFGGTFWGMLRHYHRKSERVVETAIEELRKDLKNYQGELHRLEKEILRLRAELAEDYVRQEKHSRAMERIYNKLDALSGQIASLMGGA